MTQNEAAASLFKTVDLNTFWNLHARWQAEKEYENPTEYVAFWNKQLEHGNVLCRSMSRRPFGFTFEVCGHRFLMTAKIRKGMGERILKAL